MVIRDVCDSVARFQSVKICSRIVKRTADNHKVMLFYHSKHESFEIHSFIQLLCLKCTKATITEQTVGQDSKATQDALIADARIN